MISVNKIEIILLVNNNLIDGDTVDTEKLQKEIDQIEISFGVNQETGASQTLLNGVNVEKEIRDMKVSSKVSIVAAIPFVRHALVKQQQKMGEQKGIVMDGRDIGTVVFPNAEMKVYVDASPETRAQRRYDELKAKGDTTTTYQEVLENVKYRDHLDQTREESPLRKADDAIILDNSHMTPDEQNQWLLDLYNTIVNQYSQNI